MKVLGNLTGVQNIAAWVIAGGLALGYQYYRRTNPTQVSNSEINEINKIKKTKLDEEAKLDESKKKSGGG